MIDDMKTIIRSLDGYCERIMRLFMRFIDCQKGRVPMVYPIDLKVAELGDDRRCRVRV